MNIRKINLKKWIAAAMVSALVFGGVCPNPLRGAAASPVVTTSPASNIKIESATLAASIKLDSWNALPEQAGFAYSVTSGDANPKTVLVPFSPSGSFTCTLNELSAGVEYYVKAFVVWHDGYNKQTTYGNETSFVTLHSDNSLDITTVSAKFSGGKIAAEGNSKTAGASMCGFVYSSKDETPEYGDLRGNVQTIVTSITYGDFSAYLTPYDDEDVYYVRAFVMTEKGPSYGDVKRVVLTGDAPPVHTLCFDDIKPTSARIGIYVEKNGGISETGVIYSKTDQTPSFDKNQNAAYISATGTEGESYVDITGLEPDTLYYARAYVKTGKGIGYGYSLPFRTRRGAAVKVLVAYQEPDGKRIGEETIHAMEGTILTPQHFKAFPAGYALKDISWAYTVSENREQTTVVPVEKVEMAFMEGIGDNRFAPNLPASREVVAQILYNLSLDKSYTVSKKYPDVSDNSSYKAAIDFVTYMGYMKGDDKGNFRPKGNITRAETATVLCNFYKLKGSGTPFPDTKGHWGEKYISMVQEVGMMKGYEDGTFRPDKSITRAEICATFSIAEGRSLKPLGSGNFTDVLPGEWYYEYVMNGAEPK